MPLCSHIRLHLKTYYDGEATITSCKPTPPHRSLVRRQEVPQEDEAEDLAGLAPKPRNHVGVPAIVPTPRLC